ncbi:MULTISPECIES: acyltransferase [unclassified Cryobacterium]|uniref:acyltransferase family protein n=1 Tax=unclassified Cryobacterium TaxID=2649013 RepID=UPI001E5061FC|nr:MULTISPECIES: acyltransferase [unclassified Cryobacterium]
MTNVAAVETRNTFDFLRAFAAVSVLFAHSNYSLATNAGWGAWELVDGVSMFFIMSGMFVFMSAEKTWDRTGGWRDFYLNRYLRIAPAIYSFAIFAPLILVAFGTIGLTALIDPQMVVWLGSSFVFLPNFDPSIWSGVGTGVLNGPLYTIPAEVSFYLIVPLLVLAAKRFGFWKMMSVMIAISLCGAYFANQGNDLTRALLHHTFIERAGCFSAGIILARYGRLIPLRWWAFILALLAYVLLETLGKSTFIYGAFKSVLVSIPLAYLTICVGYKGPRSLERVTRNLGDLSFGTYVWHSTVINIFLWFGFEGQRWSTIGVFASTLAVAFASWHLVEKNALKLKRVSLRGRGDDDANGASRNSSRMLSFPRKHS